MSYSNCCGAFTIETDFGICPDCREHCEFEEECEVCNGVGVTEIVDGVAPNCTNCEGTGMIQIQL